MPPSAVAEGTCPECGGRGWVLEEDGGAGAARRCRCRADAVLPRLLAAAQIPDRYRDCKLANFFDRHGSAEERAQRLEAKEVSARYLDSFVTEEGRFTDSGLLYVGPPGAGKTHLAVAVLLELIRRYRVRGLFVDFTSLLHEIQSTFEPGSPESKSELLHPVSRAEVAVLDDLGAQRPSPWVMEILYLILNSRYSRRLPTLFTTNFRLQPGEEGRAELPATPGAPEMLSSRISPNLVSRLYEMARPVFLDVGDFRREVKVKHRF